MAPTSQKVAIVTGSSSGIGLETALVLARNGFTTFATMRDLGKKAKIESIASKEKLPVHIVQLDVTSDSSVSNAVQKITEQARRIDVVVNNAGYGVMGAFEDVTVGEFRDQYETNVLGVIRVTQAVLPAMRKQRSGRIINISSVVGKIGLPGSAAYCSSKFALEGLSESLAYELEPFGISVVIVEPGAIRTNFTSGMVIAKNAQNPASPYSALMQRLGSTFEQMMAHGSEPTLVANAVLEAAKAGNPEFRYVAGNDAQAWLDSRKNASDSEFMSGMKQQMK